MLGYCFAYLLLCNQLSPKLNEPEASISIISYSFCRPEIKEQLNWVVLAWVFSRCCLPHVSQGCLPHVSQGCLRKLDLGRRIGLQGDFHAWCCLRVLSTWLPMSLLPPQPRREQTKRSQGGCQTVFYDLDSEVT